MNHYEEFIKDLPEGKLEQLGELLEANMRTSSIAEQETFKIGFCLGVRIMCSCFDMNKKGVFSSIIEDKHQ